MKKPTLPIPKVSPEQIPSNERSNYIAEPESNPKVEHPVSYRGQAEPWSILKPVLWERYLFKYHSQGQSQCCSILRPTSTLCRRNFLQRAQPSPADPGPPHPSSSTRSSPARSSLCQPQRPARSPSLVQPGSVQANRNQYMAAPSQGESS